MNRRKSKHKEKLNIAMFGQKRIPSREGGVEIVVEELCTRMVAHSHNSRCLHGININANIHAHNDFVDALVGFGLIGLGIYVYNFVKFCKNSFIWMMGTVGFLAYVNGLFVYSDIIPILIYAKLLFSHSKIQKNRIGKSL